MLKIIIALVALSSLLSGCLTAISTTAYGSYNAIKRGQYLEAANKHDPEAQYRIGESYCCGSNHLFNNREALRWLCRAARQGHVLAQRKIGDIYRSDKGLDFLTEYIKEKDHPNRLPQDDAVAFAWYSRAALQGDFEARRGAEAVLDLMERDDVMRSYEILENFPNMQCDLPPAS